MHIFCIFIICIAALNINRNVHPKNGISIEALYMISSLGDFFP